MNQLTQAIDRFDAYFRSANGVPPNDRISVPTAEWVALRSLLAEALSAQAAVPTDDELTMAWIAAGGLFFGPNTPTGSMPEAKLFPFLRQLAATHPTQQAAPQGVSMHWPTQEMTQAFGENFSTRRQSETFPKAFRAAISCAPSIPEVDGLLDALEAMVDVCEGHDFDGAPSDAHIEKSRKAIKAYRAISAQAKQGGV